MEQKKVKIAVYGSLRFGEYNYDRFKEQFGDDYQYIKTTSTTGFDLIDLGSYPGISVSKDPSKVLVIDIMECSQECFETIDWMESGAGYTTIKLKDTDGESYFAYLYNYPGSRKVVESGDWSKYLKEEKNVKNY